MTGLPPRSIAEINAPRVKPGWLGGAVHLCVAQTVGGVVLMPPLTKPGGIHDNTRRGEAVQVRGA